MICYVRVIPAGFKQRKILSTWLGAYLEACALLCMSLFQSEDGCKVGSA